MNYSSASLRTSPRALKFGRHCNSLV